MRAAAAVATLIRIEQVCRSAGETPSGLVVVLLSEVSSLELPLGEPSFELEDDDECSVVVGGDTTTGAGTTTTGAGATITGAGTATTAGGDEVVVSLDELVVSVL